MSFYDRRPPIEKPYPSRQHAVHDFERHMPPLVLAKLQQFGKIDYTVQEHIVSALRWTDAKTLAATVARGFNAHSPRRYAHDRMVQRIAAASDPFTEEGEM